MMETEKSVEQSVDVGFLQGRTYAVKKRFLDMYRSAHAGHIGCSLSCTEILVFLKFGWMTGDDRLILSKGHAAAVLYSTLAEAGDITESDIATFYKNGTALPAHPPVNRIPAIPFATGSLGHGLSLAAGMAMAARWRNSGRRFFCVTSDGELDEGSVWEAALFIAHRKLGNVIWLIDRNRIQGIGTTEEVMALEPVDEKLRAFGFHVATADGHDFSSLLAARRECEAELSGNGQPCAIICNTVKGHGVSYMQNTVDCHYLPMSEPQYLQAIEEMEKAYRLQRGRIP